MNGRTARLIRREATRRTMNQGSIRLAGSTYYWPIGTFQYHVNRLKEEYYKNRRENKKFSLERTNPFLITRGKRNERIR
jgi:hypothetical protein